MAFVKKTWKDRIAEFPTRRRLTKEDNTSELVTVAREEGTLSQEGDAFSAENMNDLENRIDAEFTEVNGKLDNIYLTTKEYETTLSGNAYVNPYNANGSYIIPQEDLNTYGTVVSVSAVNEIGVPIPCSYNNVNYINIVGTTDRPNVTIFVLFYKLRNNS